jgi:hypothetical protein
MLDKEELRVVMAPLEQIRMEALTQPRWPPGWLPSVVVKNLGSQVS